MNERLAEKVIVVIGGTTGLGLAGASACVRAGARLIVVGRNADSARAAVESLGDSRAKSLVGDAAEPQTSVRAIDLAIDAYGRFDGLYHVAGGSGRSKGDGPLDQITDEGWQYTLNQNLTSTFRSNQAAVKQFIRHGTNGTVLNMGSVLGFSPSPKYFATHAYATSKAAIEGMTKAAASYYAERHIRFNVIAPALVETPMAKRAVTDDAIMKFIRNKQPLDGGRIGQASDLDSAVVFFMSDESRFVTGQVLAIDGGWQVSEGQH